LKKINTIDEKLLQQKKTNEYLLKKMFKQIETNKFHLDAHRWLI
jgi:hypothetical protein